MVSSKIAAGGRRTYRATRFLRGVAMGSLGFCTSAAVDETGVGREWLEVVELELGIANLPEYFHGKKLVQISDLHCSTTVSPAYLKRCIQRVNQLKPDIVALTGDYITYDKRGRYKDKLVKMLAALKAPLGVYACLGNHDYGVFEPARDFKLKDLMKEIKSAGVTLLRNEASYIQFGRKKLWIVGLGDVWVDDCNPKKAFGCVPAAGPAIALVHNPEAIEHLQDWHADVILSGHTHGSSMEIPIATKLPIKQRKFIAGLVEIGGKKLYINRGLGRHGRPRLRCRPEITVFKLVSEGCN